MFYNCESLISLNLNVFGTIKLNSVLNMFTNCFSLVSINMSKFDISSIDDMSGMFRGCKSLTSIDLSHCSNGFTNKAEYMFWDCPNLEYIHLGYIHFCSDKYSIYNFLSVAKNVVICCECAIKETLITILNCGLIDCNTNWRENQLKINLGNNECVTDCRSTLNNKYNYKNKCYTICPSGTYNKSNIECADCHPDCKTCEKSYDKKSTNCKSCLSPDRYLKSGNCVSECTNGFYYDENDISIKICKCDLNKCFKCSEESLKQNLCLSCNNGYYPKHNDNNNNNFFIDCYQSLEGYYLDISNNEAFFKPCYQSCKTCDIHGNETHHNCLQCKSEYNCEKRIRSYKNCYNNCSNLFGDNNICPKELPFLIITTQECVRYCSPKELKEKVCTFHYANITDETEYMDIMLQNIGEYFLSGEYDTTKIDKGDDDMYEFGKLTIAFTTPSNQKNNNNKNLTTINLGNCETLLKLENVIPINETLYIKKVDAMKDGTRIPNIEIEIYQKVSKNKFKKLNLSICQISISVPVNLSKNENLDKLNKSSNYFNDICYKASSDSGTDIPLNDRQIDFIEENKTVCQDDCDFYNYNHSSKLAICICMVKEVSSSFADMNIDKEKLYESFDDITPSVSNFEVTKCDVFSSWKNLISNTAFYVLIIIIVIFIIIFIIFYSSGYNSLKQEMDKVIQKKFKNETKNKKDKKDKKNQKDKVKQSTTKESKKETHQRKNYKSLTNRPKKTNTNEILLKNNRNKKRASHRLSSTLTQNNNNKKLSKKPVFKPDTDYEKNWLPYEKALIYDKRSKCDYYFSLIRNKQLIMFTFCALNDYNSGIVQKFMIFLSFAFHYATNTIFFTGANLHQIYQDKGKYNFDYQIKFILLSAFVSTLTLRLILQFLVLTDKDILSVKQQQTKDLAIKTKNEKLKNMKIKFAIFFSLNFVLLVLFWFYLTCFNAIYENTEVYLIENTFISWGFSLAYPFVINLFPTIIRMSSIHSSNKDQIGLYKFSQIIQLI